MQCIKTLRHSVQTMSNSIASTSYSCHSCCVHTVWCRC